MLCGEKIRTGFISGNSDIDMCEYQGKTVIAYNAGNQRGFYYLAEAEYDDPMDDFSEAYFRYDRCKTEKRGCCTYRQQPRSSSADADGLPYSL